MNTGWVPQHPLDEDENLEDDDEIEEDEVGLEDDEFEDEDIDEDVLFTKIDEEPSKREDKSKSISPPKERVPELPTISDQDIEAMFGGKSNETSESTEVSKEDNTLNVTNVNFSDTKSKTEIRRELNNISTDNINIGDSPPIVTSLDTKPTIKLNIKKKEKSKIKLNIKPPG